MTCRAIVLYGRAGCLLAVDRYTGEVLFRGQLPGVVWPFAVLACAPLDGVDDDD